MIACAVIKNDTETWYFPTKCIARGALARDEAFAMLGVNAIRIDSRVEYNDKTVLVVRCDYNYFHDRYGRFASAQGANLLKVRDWKNENVKRDHIEKHINVQKEYSDPETYLARAIELAQMPCGGDIIGYARDRYSIVRYNKATNEYCIANIGIYGGIITLYHPTDKEAYYNRAKRRDAKDGKVIE